MSTSATPIKDTNSAKSDKIDTSAHDNQKSVENHKRAAEHYQLAAKHHLEAARHHEAGAHDKAAENTLIDIGHALLASEQQRVDAKHYALKNK